MWVTEVTNLGTSVSRYDICLEYTRYVSIKVRLYQGRLQVQVQLLIQSNRKLSEKFFTNIYREEDTGTKHLTRRRIIDKFFSDNNFMNETADTVFMIVIYRLVNRIEKFEEFRQERVQQQVQGEMNEPRKRTIVANPVIYSIFDKLTVNIDLLGGDDGDSMCSSGDHHLINQTPRLATWLELQDLSVVVVIRVVAIPSS